MKYVGSKKRLSKDLAPIIQSYINEGGYENYLEPFVGGANMIDKISCKNKYGSDSHKYLIALLKQAQIDTEVFPDTIDEDDYKWLKSHYQDDDCPYPDWYVGLIGFSSFGAKFFDSYPRGYKSDGVTKRDMVNEAIRNVKRQAPNLKDIKFACVDFRDIKPVKNFVIYCDPPYKSTITYKGTDAFPYDEFYEWCHKMSKDNVVLISEYDMPDGFECIWSKDLLCSINNVSGVSSNRTEKLFICK